MNDTQLALQSTAIQTYEQMEAASIKLSASKLMGANTTPEMVFGLMLLCQCEGLNPIAAMKRYHIVEGRPSMRADAMQAEFLAKGGGLLFHVRTDEMVAATLFIDKSKMDDASRKRATERFEILWELDAETDSQKRSQLMVSAAKLSMEGEETIIRTLADCIQKGLACKSGGEELKANWKTSPRQMLTARVITEGVRLVNPGLIAGIYSEDETADIAKQEREARETPISPEVKERLEKKVEAMIEEAHTTPDDIERARLHKEAIRLEKELNAQTPESIAIRKYEDENPEHKGKVAGASQNEDGSWSITLLETTKPLPKATRQRRSTTAAEDDDLNMNPATQGQPMRPEQGMDTPWRDFICLRGSIPGPFNGQTVGHIFTEGRFAPKNGATLEALVGTFVKQAIHTSTNEHDKVLWAKVKEAEAELREGFAAAAPTPPSSTQTTPKPAEAPQPPASVKGWRDLVITMKDPRWNGKALGSLSLAEIQQIKTDYLDKVPDPQKMTLSQKALAGNVALALHELLPHTATAEPETNEPEQIPDHTAQLIDLITQKKWNKDFFVMTLRLNTWIDESHRTVESITEDEFESLAKEWAAVETEVNKAHQPAALL